MKQHTRRIAATGALVATAAALVLTGCAASAPAEAGDSEAWRTATSAEEGGGMDALVEAAQAEGVFNSMGLYEDWANYGGLLEAFSEKYGIEIVNDTSMGSSQDLINAVKNRVGQDTSLDYLDTGVSFAQDASEEGLLAPYTPQTADDIPEHLRAADDTWINHLGGTVAIGCDTSRVAQCPTSFEELLDPQYARQIALSGDPTQGESPFMAVFAASLANGGSLDDIGPGIDFFGKVAQSGNLLQVEPNLGTVETGETPIVVNWDYLLLPFRDKLAESDVEFQVNVPTDGTVSSYYAASINADAPHPAVARLFVEFLFSDEGQNLLLQGYVSPVRLPVMVEAGTVDEQAFEALPEIDGEAPTPSLEQRAAAQQVVQERWVEAIS